MHLSGGDGPKLVDLLQMREKHALQDRIELLGPVRPGDVRDVRPVPSHPSPIPPRPLARISLTPRPRRSSSAGTSS